VFSEKDDPEGNNDTVKPTEPLLDFESSVVDRVSERQTLKTAEKDNQNTSSEEYKVAKEHGNDHSLDGDKYTTAIKNAPQNSIESSSINSTAVHGNFDNNNSNKSQNVLQKTCDAMENKGMKAESSLKAVDKLKTPNLLEDNKKNIIHQDHNSPERLHPLSSNGNQELNHLVASSHNQNAIKCEENIIKSEDS